MHSSTNHRHFIFFLQILALVFLVGFYAWNIINNFWLLPCHRDSVEYIAPAIFGTSWGGYWPWLERLTLAVGLRLFVLFMPNNTVMAGPTLLFVVNLAILITGILWAFKRAGFYASFFFAIFFSSSYLPTLYGSIVYPDQFVALFSLLTFIFFFEDDFGIIQTKKFHKFMLIAGIFAALTCFSKVMGLSTLAFFLFYLFLTRDWKRMRDFCFGLLLGSLLICTSYSLLYNPQSLVYTIKQFFVSNVSDNLDVLNKFYVSYLNIVLDMLFAPFIGLLIAIGAYRKSLTRNLFLVAWANIIIMYCYAAFAGAGNGPHARYIYTAFIFTILGLSIHFSEYVHLNKQNGSKIIIIGVALLLLGRSIGVTFDPSQYTPAKFPYYIKWLYVLGPLFILGAMILIEFFKTRWLIPLLVICISLWNTSYNGGWATSYQKLLTTYCNDMFTAAKAVNEVPSNNFGVYVSSFTELQNPERIIWIYKYFINSSIPHENGFDSLYKFNQFISQNIQYIPGERKLTTVDFDYLLTDQEASVKQHYPHATRVKEIFWKGKSLSVLKLKP